MSSAQLVTPVRQSLLARSPVVGATTHTAALPVRPLPPPAEPANWLRSEDGLVSVPVGTYDDPTGATPVPSGMAVLDLVISDVRYYFDGHNPGVFSPLVVQAVGMVYDYWDGQDQLRRFRIISVRSWARDAGMPPPASGMVIAQFQTCRTLDGSLDWIFDAVPA